LTFVSKKDGIQGSNITKTIGVHLLDLFAKLYRYSTMEIMFTIIKQLSLQKDTINLDKTSFNRISYSRHFGVLLLCVIDKLDRSSEMKTMCKILVVALLVLSTTLYK